MHDSAETPAPDLKPEPQKNSANSVGESPPIESTLLPDSAHLPVRVSMDMRDLSLSIVTAVVVVFALQWEEQFFIPLLLGTLIAYTLNPLFVWLERIKIPRMAGTSVVMLAVLVGGAFVTMSLRGQIQTNLDQLPGAASKVSVTLLSQRGGQPTTMQKVQAAAREIDKATTQAADILSTPKQAETHIVIDQPMFKLGGFLMAGSMGVFGFISESTMVFILVFFLLLSGDTFKRRLVRLTAHRCRARKTWCTS